MVDGMYENWRKWGMYLNSKESYLCWCFENIGSYGIHMRCCSQDDQRFNGDYEGRSPEQSLLLKGWYSYRSSGDFYFFRWYFHITLTNEAQTQKRKVFVSSNKEGIIGRCIYLQHGIGWTQHSGQEEGEIQYHYSPLWRSSWLCSRKYLGTC